MNKVFAASCVVALSAAWPALAAETEDGEKLTEITVFASRATAATKTDAELVEIPQSISVVTAEQFTERGALNYQDVFRYSAGVNAEVFGNDMRSDDITARGFTVTPYLDGLNKSPAIVVYGSRTEVFTLERAEVLRGPSSVLYGAGSAGGLLNAVSKRPQFRFGGEVGLEFGNWDRKQFQADVTGPLNEAGTIAGRLVGLVRDGELMSDGQADDKIVVMPSLTWKPTGQTDVTAILLYQDEDLGTQTYLPLSKTLHAAPGEKLAIDFFVGEPGINHMKTEHLAGTLLVSHHFNDHIAVSSSSRYSDQKVDYAEVYGSMYTDRDPFVDAGHTLLAREFYVLDDEYQVLNSDNHVQVSFVTGPLSHKVLAGVDYTRFEQTRQDGYSCRDVTDGSFGCFAGGSPPPLDVYSPQYGQPFVTGYTNAFSTRSTQLGFYLQNQMKYGDRVSLMLGARRDRSTSGDEPDNKATTFRAGLIVEVLPGVSPFVSYSESFVPVFGGDLYGQPYKPREGRQYEGGIKWQPMPNSLVSVAYFDIEESNFLSLDPDSLANYIQAGAVGSKGYELEVQLDAGAGFNLSLNYSHVDAEVLEGTADHPAGDRLEYIPDDLASFWASKIFDLRDAGALRLGFGLRYVGEKIDFYQRLKTPTVTLADASIDFSRDAWNASINVNNLLDKEFYAYCAQSSATDGECRPGLTRSIVARLSRKF